MCIKLDTFSLSVCHAHTLCSILGFCCSWDPTSYSVLKTLGRRLTNWFKPELILIPTSIRFVEGWCSSCGVWGSSGLSSLTALLKVSFSFTSYIPLIASQFFFWSPQSFGFNLCHWCLNMRVWSGRTHRIIEMYGSKSGELSPLTLDLACLPVVKLTMIESKQL